VLKKALFFLKFRPRSEAELRTYLVKKGASEKETEEVVGKLKQIKFVNDEEFIRYWLRRRSEGRPKAAWIIRQELKRLGVAEELIKEVMGDQNSADRDRAIKIAEKLKGKEREKIMAALARRGFDWQTIKTVVE